MSKRGRGATVEEHVRSWWEEQDTNKEYVNCSTLHMEHGRYPTLNALDALVSLELRCVTIQLQGGEWRLLNCVDQNDGEYPKRIMAARVEK